MTTSSAAHARTAQERISLVDADPELVGFIASEERNDAGLVRLPVRTLAPSGQDVQVQLGQAGAFGAIILDGLLLHELQLSDRVGVRLLGPGDLIVWRYAPAPMVVTGTRWHAASPLRLALFRKHMLAAMQRWPELLAGMYLRTGQQLDRLAAQLMLCQLPRVEDRVLALMWLMAESWGRVTGAGTRLSLDITHELIGRMIGARRPTVTLALGELADRGALIRQEDSWLLLERPVGWHAPAEPEHRGLAVSSLTLVHPSYPEIAAPEPGPLRHRAPDIASSYAAVGDAMKRLREQHLRNVAAFDRRLQMLRAARERCQNTRHALTQDRNQRLRPVPPGSDRFHHDDGPGNAVDCGGP